MRSKLASLLIAALALTASRALAGPAEDARVLFDVGAQAYEKGEYLSALEAFEQAYRLAPRQGLLFSIGQAHRKQFITGGKQPEHLRRAVAAYRQYLAEVARGGRRAEASEALLELEAIAARLSPDTPSPPPMPKVATRIMVTTQTADAQIALDDQRPREVPLVAEVAPGKHRVRVSAPGYFEETRDVDVIDGSVTPLDVVLRERPARLALRAEAGAQISVDGRFIAAAPLDGPIDLPPGRHLVSVLRNGSRAHAEEIDLGRGEERTLAVHLERTGQRTTSYALLGAGVAALAGSGVLVGVAVYHQGRAQSFEQDRLAGRVVCATQAACGEKIAAYQSSLRARDDLRRDAAITLGGGLLATAVGAALFALDFPSSRGTPTTPRDDRRTPSTPAPRPRGIEVSAAPFVGPGLGGGSVRIAF